MDKDSNEFAMIYYSNLALKITKNSIDKIDYETIVLPIVWQYVVYVKYSAPSVQT
jgi:hypothetical protein